MAATTLDPVVDQLEKEFADEIYCTSAADHTCTIEVVAVAITTCNGMLKYWCQSRYEIYLEDWYDYSIVCRDCRDSIKQCWHVRLI